MIDMCSDWTGHTGYLQRITVHSLFAWTGRELLKGFC